MPGQRWPGFLFQHFPTGGVVGGSGVGCAIWHGGAWGLQVQEIISGWMVTGGGALRETRISRVNMVSFGGALDVRGRTGLIIGAAVKDAGQALQHLAGTRWADL